MIVFDCTAELESAPRIMYFDTQARHIMYAVITFIDVAEMEDNACIVM